MKFDCGTNYEERLECSYQESLTAVQKLLTWQKRFAWWPTEIEAHDCRWLETYWVRYPNSYVRKTYRMTSLLTTEHTYEISRGKAEFMSNEDHQEFLVHQP